MEPYASSEVALVQPSSHSYAAEKLTDALECLATLPGDVRDRLLVVYECFAALEESHFPRNLHNEWRWIVQQLTRYGPVLDHKGEVREGSVQHTMRRIRYSTGSKIALKIYELYWSVSNNTQYD